MDTIVQFAGWGGVAILLGAYALLAKGIVSQRTWPYHMANFIGSMMLAFNAGMLGHKPFLVFNLTVLLECA